MTQKLHGTVRGKTIYLDEDPGLVEDQEVEVEMKSVASPHIWGEGIRRSTGG